MQPARARGEDHSGTSLTKTSAPDSLTKERGGPRNTAANANIDPVPQLQITVAAKTRDRVTASNLLVWVGKGSSFKRTSVVCASQQDVSALGNLQF